MGEVVRAGLRSLEEHEARLEAIRGKLTEAENSGPAEPFDFEQFLKEVREKCDVK